MGFFGGDTTSTQKQDSTSSQTFSPDPTLMHEWQNVVGTAGGLTDAIVNGTAPNASVAPPTDLMSQWWQQAGQMAAGPDISGVQGGLGDVYNQIGGMQRDPNDVNIPQNFNFQTPKLNFQNPYAGGIPSGQAAPGVNTDWNSYLVNTQQVDPTKVTAQQINAPTPVGMISSGQLERVNAPQLQNYQFDPRMLQQVQAPNLQNFQMQAAPSIAPSGLATTQSWNDPGTAQQFMSPYAQQVVDVQKQKAVEDWQAANETQRSQAVAAGAYGGDRQAVAEATGQRDLQLQLAQLQATGLQNAYTQGLSQFNTQQQAQAQAQQFNISTAQQAALANQANQQQANVQNLSSFLQTQGLGAQTGLAAAQGNQQAALNVGGQNLAANLGVQQLGSGQNMQAQLANQGQNFNMLTANQQTGLANNQLLAQILQANQNADLQAQSLTGQFSNQAQISNQQAGLQAGLAAKQLGFNAAQGNQQWANQFGLANLSQQGQALANQGQWGLAGAMQTQQLANQNPIIAAQMGMQGATTQEQLRQAQQGMNIQGAVQQGNVAGMMGNLGLGAYGAGLQGWGALGQAAGSQQGMSQQERDTAYANAMQQIMFPLQSQGYLASLLAMQPVPYTATGQQQGTTTLTQPGPSIFSQILGGALGAAGIAGGLGFKPFRRKGGLVAGGGGLGAYAKGGEVHQDAAADRQQMLKILREKKLIKRAGGLAAVA
jgi:hypothetical protein